MAYGKLIPGKDNTNLQELEYILTKGKIVFSTFTSCIGIVGKIKKDCLFGVHLPISATEDITSKFDIAAADAVIKLFKKNGFKPEEHDWSICGLTNIWKDSKNGVHLAYKNLELLFSDNWQNPAEDNLDRGSGNYSVDAKLKIQYKQK